VLGTEVLRNASPAKTPLSPQFAFCFASLYNPFALFNLTIFYAGEAEKREAGCAGGSPPEDKRRRENPFRKRAIERMNNALHFLRTLAEFRESYLLLKRYGIPLVPFSWISPHKINSTLLSASLERDFSRWWLWLEYWLAPITEEFLSYLEAVKNRRLVFRDKLSGALRIVPYTTRFSEVYQRKVYGRFKGLKWDYGLFLTITTDLSRYNDIVEATKGIRKAENRVISALKRELKAQRDAILRGKKHNGEDKLGNPRLVCDASEIEFVSSLEFSFGGSKKKKKRRKWQDNDFKTGHGAVHLHIVLKRVRYISISWLLELLEGHTRIVDVEFFRDLRVDGYLFKYLRKQVLRFEEVPKDVMSRLVSSLSSDFKGKRDSDVIAILSSALLWVANARGWSCSRSLSENWNKVNPSTYIGGGLWCSFWGFLGCFPAFVAEHLDFQSDPELWSDSELWVYLRGRRKDG